MYFRWYTEVDELATSLATSVQESRSVCFKTCSLWWLPMPLYLKPYYWWATSEPKCWNPLELWPNVGIQTWKWTYLTSLSVMGWTTLRFENSQNFRTSGGFGDWFHSSWSISNGYESTNHSLNPSSDISIALLSTVRALHTSFLVEEIFKSKVWRLCKGRWLYLHI